MVHTSLRISNCTDPKPLPRFCDLRPGDYFLFETRKETLVLYVKVNPTSGLDANCLRVFDSTLLAVDMDTHVRPVSSVEINFSE